MAKKKKQAKSAAKAIKPPEASPSVAPEVKAAAKPAEKPKAPEKTKTPALKAEMPKAKSAELKAPALESLREQGRSGKIFGLESCQHRECAGTEGRSGEGFCSGAQGQSACESRGRTDRKACHRQASRGQACPCPPCPAAEGRASQGCGAPRAPARPRRRR